MGKLPWPYGQSAAMLALPRGLATPTQHRLPMQLGFPVQT